MSKHCEGMMIDERMRAAFEKRKLDGNLRQFLVRNNCIDFTSNDYLGLAQSLELKKSIELSLSTVNHCAHGSTGSRLLTGHFDFMDQLERTIAKFHSAEAALVYNSGYLANVGLLGALLKPEDTMILDLNVHASIYDGMRFSRVKGVPFRHNDCDHLERRLRAYSGKSAVFVCVESVYSLDGSMAPLKNISEICRRYGASLIVDEAHAIGVIGDHGRGLVCQLGLENEVFARICAYGKAFGVSGGAVLGSQLLKDFLINHSRTLWYTTAMPLYLATAIQCSYRHVKKADPERHALDQLIAGFRQLCQEKGLPASSSQTPIQSVVVPGNDAVRKASSLLAESQLDVRPVMSPTVHRGKEMLRICLHAFNTNKQLQDLVSCLARVVENIERNKMFP